MSEKKKRIKDNKYCPGTRIYSCIKDTFAAFKEQGIEFISSVATRLSLIFTVAASSLSIANHFVIDFYC